MPPGRHLVSTYAQDFTGDELARLYQERFNAGELNGKRQLWQALYDGFLKQYVRENDTVLDLGAGSCEFINSCHARTKIAVDLNPETKRFARGAQVMLAASHNMPDVGNGTVDVVFTSNFFEHLPDKRALMDTLLECHRVLRDQGQLLVLMPNLRYVGVRYWDYFDHHLPMTHASLVEGLKLSGFHSERVIPRFLPYTVKDSPVKVRRSLVLAYLRFRPAWRLFGGQMFVAARKSV